MGKRIFLHVGLHKTGTTSIQWALSRSRKELMAAGFVYPQSACPEWARFGQHLLPWSVLERKEYLPSLNGNRASFTEAEVEAIWEGLREEIEASGCDNVILSSEEFDTLADGEIEAVRKRLDGYAVIPVIFLRYLPALIESSYRTAVVYSAYTNSAEAFAQNQRTRLDYHAMARAWLSTSAEGRIHLIHYDDAQVKADSLAAFCRVIGLPTETIPDGHKLRQNESVPAHICELMRFMRLKGADEEVIRRWLNRMKEKGITNHPNVRCLPRDTSNWLAALDTEELGKIRSDDLLGASLIGTAPVSEHTDGTQPDDVTVDNPLRALLILARD